jgi:hypothetical protein
MSVPHISASFKAAFITARNSGPLAVSIGKKPAQIQSCRIAFSYFFFSPNSNVLMEKDSFAPNLHAMQGSSFDKRFFKYSFVSSKDKHCLREY